MARSPWHHPGIMTRSTSAGTTSLPNPVGVHEGRHADSENGNDRLEFRRGTQRLDAASEARFGQPPGDEQDAFGSGFGFQVSGFKFGVQSSKFKVNPRS